MNKKLPLLFFLVVIASKLFAQNDSAINHNIRMLEDRAAAKPIEKVHLHLDRQLYFPGDTIWFKAYVVLGEYHKLSALSGILYAELIDPKDSVIKRLNLGLQAGTASGDFELPFNLTPGTYRIRAYTTWMRNFGSEYFFDQPITVAGFSTVADPAQMTSAKAIDSHTPDKVDLQFFPEGGDLVNGIRSKVAFKAINQNGMAEEVQGSVFDNSGSEVATFTSQHLGMGAFPLEPQKGKQYFAKVTTADGSAITVPLPAAKDAGFTLSVNNLAGDSLYVKVAAVNTSDTAFYLIAQNGGAAYFAGAHKLQDKVYTESLAKSRFPTGILQFTLFSENGEPLNERIVFIQNDDQLRLSLTTDKQTYAPGERVKLSLEAKDQQGEPIAGTFSVAVVDEAVVPVNEASENTIFTDLLLRSELAGYIETPNYYFINPTDQTKADLDLLMLTQGYSRFEWKKILNNDHTQAAYRPEKGFTLSGTVTTQAGIPIPKGKVILSSIKNKLALDTLTDENGKFAFNNIVLPDTTTLVVNAKKANGGNNVVLTMDKPLYAAVSKMNAVTGYIINRFNGEVQPDEKQVKLAYAAWRQDSLGHVIQLKEVTVKDHKIPPYHPDYSKVLAYSANLNGPGNANQVYLPGDELLKYGSLAEGLQGKLQGVTIGNPPFVVAISTRAKMRQLKGAVKPMAIYVDGIQVRPDYLDNISPSEVYSIEVLTSAMYYAIYGSAATGGALIITLKNGAQMMDEIARAPGIITYKFKGFYKAFVFYSPKNNAPENAGSADNPKTIYWSPSIITDPNGKASFEYFNAGSKGRYWVIAEGLGADGKLARQFLKFKVDFVQ